MRRLDRWLLDWTASAWKQNDKAILDKVADLKPPYKGLLEKSILIAMLETWREGRKQSAQVLQRIHGRSLTQRKKEVLRSIKELVDEEEDYELVVAAYGAWATRLGEEAWNGKIDATKKLISAGVVAGWGLYDYKVYTDNQGARVSALEATGSAAGAGTLKQGYQHIIKTPGVISQLSRELVGYTSWQLERTARTETTRAYNQGVVSGYKDDTTVVGYEFVAIIDSRTTDRCFMLDGTIIHKDDPRLYELTPPLHVNCRSQLSPIFVFDERIASTLDDKVTKTLVDKTGKEYTLTFDPSRMTPMTQDGKLTKAGFGRENLMTVAKAEVRRENFVPPSADDMRRDFLGR